MALALILPCTGAFAQTNEFRGMWVNAWNAGLLNASQVTSLVNNIRAANMNAVIAQVRRRGDALYNSHYEPFATGLSPANFDALGDLITKAHNTNTGQYLEVHAWLVTYHIKQGAANPPQASHPLNLHPEWLLTDVNSNNFIGNEYTFDPGHPEVQQHTFNVAMDIVTNYNVDGLNFDYIRYSSADEGYNPVTVARFNRRFNRTGRPAPTDATWKQFRRDQITGLLRKVYLNAIAVKPMIKISADTITWAPGPPNDSAWYSSAAAWNSVLQDWRGWMEEGILDYSIPMNYFSQAGAYTSSWTNWCNFARDHQFNRQSINGPGIYLNTLADAIVQLRHSRRPSPAGNSFAGVAGYDYNTPYTGGGGQFGNFRTYLTSSPNANDPVSPAIFAEKATIPVMTWKSAPTKGHLKGMVYGGSVSNALDGAVVRLIGASARVQTNDATGFYGFVDLTPGNYTVYAAYPGFPNQTNTLTITAGAVATVDLLLNTNGPPAIVNPPQSLTVAQGDDATFAVSLNGTPPFAYQWQFDGADLVGATQSTYTLNFAQPGDAGPYTVVVTNALGSVTSSVAMLTVIIPPALALQPVSQSVTQGVDVSFTVTATGTEPFGYQWRFNGNAIAGATASRYTLLNVQPADAGNYSVTVSNFADSVTSTNAALDVTQAAVPAGISVQPADATLFAGQTAVFSVVAHGATPLTYQWRFHGTNLPGATASQLVLNNVQTNVAGGYQVAVGNAYGSTNSRTALLTVSPAFVASSLKVLWRLAPGSRPYLTVGSLPNERGLAHNPVTDRLILVNRTGPTIHRLNAADGADEGQLNNQGVSGGTYPLLMAGVAEDGVVYAGNLTTAGTTLPYRLYRWANDATNTVPTLAYFDNPGAGLPAAQRWGDTLAVRGAGTNTQVLIGSRAGNVVALLTTTNGSDFVARVITVADAPAGAFGLGLAFGEGNTFWGKATSQNLRQVAFDPVTGVGTILRNHGSPAVPSTLAPIGVNASLNLLGAINVGTTDNHFRLYNLAATPPVFIASTNFASDNDNTGSGTGAVDFHNDHVYALGGNNGLMAMQIMPVSAPPVIASQPQSQSAKVGAAVSFTVTATGTALLSYQWQFNTADIPGATNSTLTLSPVMWEHEGEYAVTVTNAAGVAYSAPAVLTVLPVTPAVLESVQWLPDGRVQFTGSGDPGNYSIQASTNLLDWELVALVANTTGQFSWMDETTNAPQRFYRAQHTP